MSESDFALVIEVPPERGEPVRSTPRPDLRRAVRDYVRAWHGKPSLVEPGEPLAATLARIEVEVPRQLARLLRRQRALWMALDADVHRCELRPHLIDCRWEIRCYLAGVEPWSTHDPLPPL